MDTMTSGDPDRGALLLAVLRDLARDSHLPEPPGGLTLDTRLESELGLDSLGRSELLCRLERAWGAALPDEALLAATGRDLLRLVRTAGDRGAPDGARAPIAGPADGEPDGAGTLLAALDWHVERHPQRVHIHVYGPDDRPEPIDYQGLALGAARVAGRLMREGLSRGDTVALMLPTGLEYFCGFYGILTAGGIPVPIYPPARLDQIEDHLRRHARILENAGTVFLITVPEGRTAARLLRALVGPLRAVLTLEGLDAEPPLTGRARPGPADIAFLQYTSGSTGDPKGVILSHADLLANIRAMGTAIGVRPDDRFVSWLPLYHDMGLIGAWLSSLYYGLPLVSLSPLAFLARPLRWLKAIQDHRGTLSAAPNFAYELCLSRISDQELAGLDLSSWRWAFNGAEPVSPDTLRRFAERFAPCGLRPEALAPVYGLAESAVGLAFPPPDRGPLIDRIDRGLLARSGEAVQLSCEGPGTLEVVACGRPLPGYRVRAIDAGGRALPERREGLLEFQGPSATRGYYRNPAATAALIRDGWHNTGDRAYLADGEIYLTGRVKDLIIRGGRNLYPYELEQAVGALPGVRKGCVAAFAAADPLHGSERLVLVAETRERDPARRAELMRTVRECTLEILDLPPDEIVLAPPRSVLKTSSGKLRRAATRELYLSGRLESGAPGPIRQILRIGASGLWAAALRALRGLPQTLYAGYAWGLFLAIGPCVWLAVATLPWPAWRWNAVRGGIGLLRRLACVRLAVEGRERVPPPGQPFVLVANHQSYLDALVLIEAVGRPLGFVAKQELAANPLVRILLSRTGTLFVERFDRQRSAGELERLTAALGQGDTLALFPEGTFREEPGLLPFRTGAFLAAARSSVPVLPVALRGTRDLMLGARFFPHPGRATLVIGQPLVASGGDWQAAVRLREEARAFIARHCGDPDCAQRAD